MDDDEVWGLHHDGKLVARLVVTGGNFPWLLGRVEELPGFDAVRDLFAEDERAHHTQDYEAMAAAGQRIEQHTTMTYPDGSPVAEYWLRVSGDGTCAWRWSD